MTSRRLLIFAVFVLVCAQPLFAADYSWLDGLSLVTFDGSTPQDMHRARVLIQKQGGTVGVMSMSGALLAWLDDIPRNELTGKEGIREIHDEPVAFESLENGAQKQSSDLRYFVEFFNSAASGRYAREQNARPHVGAIRTPGGDERPQEPLDLDTYIDNLERHGYTREQLEELGELGAPKAPNNDSMSGTILASVFIVESDGSGTDPNNHDWSDEEVQEIINARIAGLLWWTATADVYGNCWAAFLVEFYLPTDPRLQSPLEPVASSEVSTVMQQVMTNFGYFGSAYNANTAFNTARRLATGTNRAFSLITTWGSGRAWAYRFGPYTWLPYPAAAPEVTAHETGHIFGACDEYAEACVACPDENCQILIGGQLQSACSANGSCNYNCELCENSTNCVMNANNFVLCPYTDNHVGWGLVPCAPPQLPWPTLGGISPGSGIADETQPVTVTITGTNLLQAAQLDLGPGVNIYEMEYIGSTQIIARITIAATTTPGFRDAEITNPDLKKAILPNAFEVLPSLSHYYSPTGGNVYPYTSPANAATSLSAAIAATGPGDTVYLTTTNLFNVSLLLTRALTLSGGWDPSFSSQDLVTKTEIDTAPNIRAVANLGLDNLRFINGTGRIEVLPVEGAYGGAVAVFGGDLTITNCEFENNIALDPANVGLGGAAYVEGGTVTIDNSTISGNSAYLGGALYLENCAVQITNSSITGNDIQYGGSVGLKGSAIYALNCSSFVVDNCNFDLNVGADHGGALYLNSCAGVQLLGGSFTNHNAAQQGGAVWLSASSALIQGVYFAGNSSGSSGGAIYGAAGSSLTVLDNHFSGNTSLLGAAVQISSGEAFVDHNLFTGNQSTVTGNAIYISSLTDGSVIGNVAADNLGPLSATDLLVVGSVEVKNNIVLNATGVGITCGGGPDVDYNLVHNSAGAPYSGCSEGVNTRSGDPLFIGSGDYHLGLHSPAIDRGDPTRNDADGSPGDLGLYGAHALSLDQPAPPANLGSQISGQDIVLNWDANGEGDLASYAIYADASSGFVPSLSNFLGLVPAGTESFNLGQITETTYVRINAIDTDGYAGGYSAELVAGPATAVDPPQRFEWALARAIPNPFNPRTRIEFELAADSHVELVVFDVTGRVVRMLVQESRPAGRHGVEWDARDDAGRRVASGIYYYELRAGSFRATEKMVLLK